MERPWLISIRVFGPHNAAYYFAFLAILSFAIACWAWNSGAPQDVTISITISAIALGSFCCVIAAMVHRPRPGAVAVDSSLFDEPPQRPDCDIFFLPMPHHFGHRMSLPCCGKEICGGCFCRLYVSVDDGLVVDGPCPFCRSGSIMVEKVLPRLEERVERGDTRAMVHLAMSYEGGEVELSVDSARILDLYHRAALLGNAEACFFLGVKYAKGKLVERDEEKARKYFILAIKQGHILARY